MNDIVRKSLLLMPFLVSLLWHVPFGYASPQWPNEPVGSQLLSDFPFDAKDGNGWIKDYPSGNIISDPTAPLSAPNVLQYTWYHNGFTDVSYTGYYLPSGGVSSLYFGFWWKPSNPFTGWATLGFQKVALIFNDAPGTPRPGKFYLQMAGPQGGTQTWNAGFNFPQANCHLGSGYGDCPGSYNLFPNSGNGTITLGQWHRIEFYGKIGSCDTCQNGILRMWVNGVLVHNFNKVNYPGPFTRLLFAPVWDANEATCPSCVDRHWFDHARVSVPPGSSQIEDNPPGPPARPEGVTVTVR